MESSPNTFLSFNEQMTQESIFQRLSTEMSREWFRYRRDKGIPKGAVRFAVFADWIKDQASIELERIGSDRGESLSSISTTTPKEKTESAPSRSAYQPPHHRTPESSSPKRCRCCEGTAHMTHDCPNLKNMSPEDQWTKFTGICRYCLDLRTPHGSFERCPLKDGPTNCKRCTKADSHHQRMWCKPGNASGPLSRFNNRQQ